MSRTFFDSLIPQPRRIELTGGVLHGPFALRLAFENLPHDHARNLQAIAREALAPWLFSGRRARPLRVSLATGRLPSEQAYILALCDTFSLESSSYAALVHGLHTLKQILENAADAGSLPAARITDWPRLPTRGIHYDLAREMEYRPAHLRAVLRYLAYFRFNTLHLYLENKFAFPSCPHVAPPRVMTPTQARQLCHYARRYGITIIPQIPTLGHMGEFLHGDLAALREDPASPWNLCPSHPQARPFLAGIIRDVAEAFRPPFIHVGYDESHSGVCPRCQSVGTPQEILADHLNWLNLQVKKHGARTMIYGDKFLSRDDFPQADAVNGGSSQTARHALQRVDRDILITDWHYTAPYAGTSRYLIEQGFEVHTCCATNLYWHDSIPTVRGSHWIAESIEEGIRAGVTGAFNANWEFYRGQFLDNFWYFQALAAERIWSDRPHDYTRFGPRFSKRFWGVDDDIYSDLARLAETTPTNRRKVFLDSSILEVDIPYSLGMLWQHWWQTVFDYVEIGHYIIRQAARLKKAAQRNRHTLRMLEMPGEIIRYVGLRARQRVAIEQALARNDRATILSSLDTLHAAACRIQRLLERGYRLYGGAVHDRTRIADHLANLERIRTRLKEVHDLRGVKLDDLVAWSKSAP